ncbi:MAG: hypothetical protein O8C63_08225 [Candidatus Methanoperedens sp.]|nr:hypothetical protein [Candidatus Methanoperedens sp.]
MKARPKENATRNQGPRYVKLLFRVITKIADNIAGISFFVKNLTSIKVLNDIMKTNKVGSSVPISNGDIPVKREASAMKRL